ncbi:hypothetical protein ILYODFUR_017270 [Ilyodon furcidens]|uniref:Uncharacterized protein n=1 Tax=Ilyodon furcidens TaxID=33524 RepID=A0ABV0USQ2_9TELE
MELSLMKPGRRSGPVLAPCSPDVSIFSFLSITTPQQISNLLFAVVHVVLGEQPDFTSDIKNPTRKQTHLVFIGDKTKVAVGRSSDDQNLMTSDLIFPQHLTGHYRLH